MSQSTVNAPLIDRLLARFGQHYILLMMIATRLFGSTGGLMVIYYVEFTMDMPPLTRLHFRITSLIVVVVSCALTVLLALWETRRLRRVLTQLKAGEPVDADLGSEAGREAVGFAARHHRHEAWLVPCTTWLPALLILKIVDNASSAIMINITIAAFMAISLAVMSHFYVVEHCMKAVIRHLLQRGVHIDYDAQKPGRLRMRMRVSFALVIATTALMIGTVASQRATEIISNPEIQDQAVHELRYHSVFITIAALVLGIAYATVVGDSVATRVRSLVTAMDRVGSGDLSERVLPTGNDEIDMLARRFNAMVEHLEKSNQTIRDLNATLERKVTQRTQELNGTVATLRETQKQLTAYNEQLELARAEAESANRAKGEFLTNMSHELRTPLNGVIGLNDLLLNTNLDPKQVKYALAARSSGETLLQLLNDLLDVSKIEAGKLELESIDFDVTEAIESVMNTVAHRCEPNVELICSIDPQIPSRLRGDSGRLRQILTNLTSNALKFTERGEVVVRADLSGERDGKVELRFEVSDTGVGVPADQIDRIFEAFTQADASTTRKYGGTGLGLRICRQLCELMGGEIEATSEVERGSSFVFTVVLEPSLPEMQLVVTVPPCFRTARALVVDGNATVAGTLVEQLQTLGLTATAACDAAAARAELTRAEEDARPFNLVLADKTLVDAAPPEFAQEMQRQRQQEPTRLIALIRLTSAVAEKELQAAGYHHSLTKPVLPSELLHALQMCLTSVPEPFGDPSPKEEPRRRRRRNAQKHPARILLAEDQVINQMVVVETLAQAGYQCDVVRNGREAVETLATNPYDLVLMDCQMPEMDGLEATQRIRRMEESRSGEPKATPVVALTANAMQGERERCLDAGMTDYLSKPIHPEQLIDTIERYIEEFDRLWDQREGGPAADAGSCPAETEPANTDLADSPASNGDAVSLADEDDVLRLDALLSRCSGKTPLAMKLLTALEARFPGDLEAIEESIATGDTDRLAEVAHAVTGVTASLGAESMQRAAEALERSGREGTLQDATRQRHQLRDAWKRFQARLQELRNDESFQS